MNAPLHQRPRSSPSRPAVALLLAALLVPGALPADEPPPESAGAAVPGPEAPPAPPAAEPSPAARRDASSRTLERLVGEARYAEALDIATQLVALTRSIDGEASAAHGSALARLGAVQFELGDNAAAETSYRAAVEIIERAAGPASPLLVEPLAGLGDTLLRTGYAPQALEVLQRALLLSHANDGFYNLGQMPVLDALAEAQLALDKPGKATWFQRRQVEIQKRRLGPDNPELAPALYKLGRWYIRTGQFAEARRTYQEAGRLFGVTAGTRDAGAVDALVGEALTYSNEGDLPSAVATLKRALDVLDLQPQPQPLKRAEVLVALADLHIAFRRPRTAHPYYLQAWQALAGDDPAFATQRESWFGRTARITGPELPAHVDAAGKQAAAPRDDARAWRPGVVVAQFSVDTDGLTRDARIIESDPPGLLDARLLRMLSLSTFRPRIVDGQPVAGDPVQLRHEFRYLPGATGTDAEAAPAPDADAPLAYPQGGEGGEDGADDHGG